MGCKGCGGKSRKAVERVYVLCPVCGTELHGAKKDMVSINGHPVCGLCYKKYIEIKKLEKVKVK